MIKKTSLKSDFLVIKSNKKAYFNFFIEKKFEAGMSLKGWEVKSLRLNIVNISTAYISIDNREIFLCGAYFERLSTTFQHMNQLNNDRKCKLLLNNFEINFLSSKINQKGYTIVPLSIILKKSWYKLQLGLAIGKKNQDKRICEKKRTWMIEKNRIMKNKY